MAQGYEWDRDRSVVDALGSATAEDEDGEAITSAISLDYSEAMRHLLDPEGVEAEAEKESSDYDFPIECVNPEEDISFTFGASDWR
jgi:hypothetical protein